MVCRYDTAALKVLDVFSIHGFPVSRVQCEAALIGIPGVGSGAWRHFVGKYAAAKRYCEAPFETVREDGRKRQIAPTGERIAATLVEAPEDLSRKRSALLRCGSLTTEPLPDEVASMVLTDPPYYANVAYSELMDFPYAWLRRLVSNTSYFSGLKYSLRARGYGQSDDARPRHRRIRHSAVRRVPSSCTRTPSRRPIRVHLPPSGPSFVRGIDRRRTRCWPCAYYDPHLPIGDARKHPYLEFWEQSSRQRLCAPEAARRR